VRAPAAYPGRVGTRALQGRLARPGEWWALKAEAANRAAQAWAKSEQCYNLRRAAELRRVWCDWHCRQAAIFQDLAAEHRAESGRLKNEGARRCGSVSRMSHIKKERDG
jgi:hypothetical protein